MVLLNPENKEIELVKKREIVIIIVDVVECNSRAYFGTETTRVMVNNVEHTLNVHNVEHTLSHTSTNVL